MTVHAFPGRQTARAPKLAMAVLADLERAPMRAFDIGWAAAEALSDTDLIEKWTTDVGATWVRITDAGRDALEAHRALIRRGVG